MSEDKQRLDPTDGPNEPGAGPPGLQRVLEELRRYEHPLVEFGARAKGAAVEVSIAFRYPGIPVHSYYFEVHPRDLDSPQFSWQFQRQLYDSLHDYFIEMFIRTPQDGKGSRQGR